jgi:hypothetical protein
MSGPDHDQHDAGWRERLAALAVPETGDPTAEDRAVKALQAAALLRTRSRGQPVTRILLPLAAAVVLFWSGGRWARRGAGTPDGRMPQYVLLLLEDSTFRGGAQVGHDSLVAEYSAWAGELAGTGNLIMGEELDPAAYPLGNVTLEGVNRVTGLFVITAESLEKAMGIARSCPHLRYGGGLVVRPIVPT